MLPIFNRYCFCFQAIYYLHTVISSSFLSIPRCTIKIQPEVFERERCIFFKKKQKTHCITLLFKIMVSYSFSHPSPAELYIMVNNFEVQRIGCLISLRQNVYSFLFSPPLKVMHQNQCCAFLMLCVELHRST